LLITVPGRSDAPGTLFESHIDTVPADDWTDTAFVPRIEGNKFYGRGACDDKGSLAGMVLALLQVLESGEPPPATVWLLAAGDEEYGQSGIRHFMAQSTLPLGRGIFGEPTGCLPVIQQKGVLRWDVTVRGHSAHTSQPELGRNAILDMFRVVQELALHQVELRERYHNPLTGGPTITVTMIHGGRTRNAVPDECNIAVDFRIAPEMDRAHAFAELQARLHELQIPLIHSDFQCYVPGLQTAATDPLVLRALEICGNELSQSVAPAGAPYGSDACWMPSGAPAIVLGPGNIAQAHAVNEFIDLAEVRHATSIYHQLMRQAW
jgi:acetylornithine deacetylase